MFYLNLSVFIYSPMQWNKEGKLDSNGSKQFLSEYKPVLVKVSKGFSAGKGVGVEAL